MKPAISVIAFLMLFLMPMSKGGDLSVGSALMADSASEAPTIATLIGKNGTGNWLGIEQLDQGIQLNCALQKLQGELGEDGLWVVSSGTDGEKFQIKAMELGRGELPPVFLSDNGTFSHSEDIARFVREGLVEEYSVSTDGIRQDFLVDKRPAGEGQLRLGLQVKGAVVKVSPEGGDILMEGSERRLCYHKLLVTDCKGRELPARFEASQVGVAVMVDDSEAEYPLRVDPTFSDSDWEVILSEFKFPASRVNSAVVDASGNLYIGGTFTSLGNYLAKWDGNTWTKLGDQIGLGLYNKVDSLHCVGNDLYVGGVFQTAGGVTVNNIAKWNGSSWQALGSGTNGSVLALKFWQGSLYAGGGFTTAGGVGTSYIAKWDGSTWRSLGTGVDGSVKAMASIGTKLYVGGVFRSAGGTAIDGLAQWDGSSWSKVGQFQIPDDIMFYNNGVVYPLSVDAMAVDGSTLYVAANCSVWYWNGLTWGWLGNRNILSGTPMYRSYHISSVIVSGGKVHISGTFEKIGDTIVNHVARWNSTNWESLDSGVRYDAPFFGYVEPDVRCLVQSGDRIIAGGYFLTAGGLMQPGLTSFTNGRWLPLGRGPSGSVKASVSDGVNEYIAGDFKGADGLLVNHVAHRPVSGGGWLSLGAGTNGKVNALAFWNDELYAGGEFSAAGANTAANIAKWNGSSWEPVGNGFNGAVNAIITWNGELYAAGEFTHSGEVFLGGIAKWNGILWEPLGIGTDGMVNSMTHSGDYLYAGGTFYQAGGLPVNLVARWDGSQWSAMGNGADGFLFPFVSALATSSSGEVYMGGFFGTAGNQSAANVAKWDGNSWSAMGPGLTGAVNALTVRGKYVYAGGGFDYSGSQAVSKIACWDGLAWSPLGGGTNQAVNSLYVSGDRMFVGGDFTLAGGNVADRFVKIKIPVPPEITSPVEATAKVGEPFSYRITANYEPTSFLARLANLPPSPFPEPGPAAALLPPGLVFDLGTGEISGTPTSAGTYSVVIGAMNMAGTETSLLNLVVEASSPLQSWAEEAGLTGANAEPQAIPFQDGVPNLVKYAFNMDPSRPDHSVLSDNGTSGLPLVDVLQVNQQPSLRVTFLRRKNSGLNYIAERSDSMDSFVPMIGVETITDVDDTWERVEIIESPNSTTTTRRGFARVRVALP